ncbi:MAG: hypothetical protein R3D02_02070 [Hyphomicrobiales bacterium]
MQAIRTARRDAPVALRANRLDILTEAAIAIGAEMMVPDIFLETDPRLAGATRFDVRAERELWLLVHPERRHVPAVAAVVDWIADVIGTAMP